MPAIIQHPLFRIVGLVSAGVIHTLSLAPFDWWPLGIASVMALLWLTGCLQPRDKNNANMPRKAAFYGWLYGLGLFGSGASWVYVSIHVYGYASPALAGTLTLFFVAGLALFPALQLWLHARLRGHSVVANGLLFVALWVFSDVFRSHFLTGFPWLFLGYGHLSSPLAGWIPVLGVYGVSFLVCLSAVLLYLLVLFREYPKRLAALATLALIWWQGAQLQTLEWTRDSGYELDVALLQINIPQELKWHPSQRQKTARLLQDMTREHWDKEIVVWPETALPILYDQAQPFLDTMAEEAIRHDTNILSGIPYRELDGQTRRARLHNSIISIGVGEGINHKQKLVPFGEYVPLQEYLRGLIAFFDLPMSDFRKGPEQQDLLLSHALRVAPFICYEVVYPDFVAQRSRGADYLVTISNDSWFGASIGPLQHLQMAQMRAAENARYMLRGTNNGVSAIIDHRGRITARSEQFVRASVSGKVAIRQGLTPYARLGSTPTLLLCFLLLIGGAYHHWRSGRTVSASTKLG